MVTAVNLTANSTGASTSSVTTASVTPSANKLQLLAVNSRNFTGSAPPAPTVTGCGLTWVPVATLQYDTGPTSLKRVTVLRAMGASPTTGALTIDFAGDSQTDVCWSLDEFTGMDTGGTNGSAAIVQSVTAKDETGSATSITATLAAFGSTSNGTYGAFAHVAPTNGATASAGSGFTALASPVDATIGLITQFKTTNDTTVDGSISGVSYELGMIAIEIKAAGGTGATVNGQTLTATASLVAGTATGQANQTVAGQTLTATASLVAGAISGQVNRTVSGQVLTATASLVAGAAAGQSNATVAGQTLTATASMVAGAVTGQQNQTVAGQVLTAVASLIAGAASAGTSASVAGQILTAAASLIAGAVTGAVHATASGQVLTAVASLISGGATGDPPPGGTPIHRRLAIALGIGL